MAMARILSLFLDSAVFGKKRELLPENVSEFIFLKQNSKLTVNN